MRRVNAVGYYYYWLCISRQTNGRSKISLCVWKNTTKIKLRQAIHPRDQRQEASFFIWCQSFFFFQSQEYVSLFVWSLNKQVYNSSSQIDVPLWVYSPAFSVRKGSSHHFSSGLQWCHAVNYQTFHQRYLNSSCWLSGMWRCREGRISQEKPNRFNERTQSWETLAGDFSM